MSYVNTGMPQHKYSSKPAMVHLELMRAWGAAKTMANNVLF